MFDLSVTCPSCGCQIGNVKRHEGWHQGIANLVYELFGKDTPRDEWDKAANQALLMDLDAEGVDITKVHLR